MRGKSIFNHGLLMMGLSAASFAGNDCQQWAAKITALEGQVEIIRTGIETLVQAQSDQIICVGETVKTAANGKVVLLLNKETLIEMHENSHLHFSTE